MSDDPRQILAEAGVECAEVDAYEYADENRDLYDPTGVFEDRAHDFILALARLVAKYKQDADHWREVVMTQADVLARVRKTWYPIPVDRWYREAEDERRYQEKEKP